MNLPVIQANLSALGLFRYEDKIAVTRPNASSGCLAPTLFISGSRSPFLSWPRHQAVIHALFPLAQHVQMATGHWVHAEAPDEFCRAVNSFLRTSSA